MAPFKRIRLYGKRYVIAPTLDNMCALEESTGKNLLMGVNPKEIDLRFMRAVIENIVECEDGTHIPDGVLSRLYAEDIKTAQAVFADCYSQMYHFPNIKHNPKPSSSKKQKTPRRIFGKRLRGGL